MNRLIAVAVLAGAFLAAACTTTGEIEGHKVRATGATTVTQTTVTHTGIHASAPQWFKDYWLEFLARGRGGYAVMAVDRRLRGAFYVYCTGGGCQQLRGAGAHRGWKAVNYKHGALKGCREQVRNEYPAVKPACAVYAITNKIVWKGSMPWE